MANKVNKTGRQPTQEEEMSRRQSSSKPTIQDAVVNAMASQMAMQPQMTQVKAEAIGKEQIAKATQILNKYKEGKANLENRIVENEQWYKLRHWDHLKSSEAIKPTSAWLFNCIANKHADAMDNFPTPNILPREAGDRAEAKMLSSIIPVILDQNDFEKTYDEVWTYKLKSGTGVYGVFWDKSKLNGLGDITIKKCDLLNLFWESGVTDIQKSRNLFHVELMDNEILANQYPELSGKLGTETISIAKYIYDDSVDTTDKSVVVDWYYKKTNSMGKEILHYCKFCNGVVLFSTENNPDFADKGLYDHGKYPFVFDPLYRVEGTPAGFGYIDIGKNSQEYIDRLNQVIIENAFTNAKPRYFIRADGAVKEEEYADWSKDFVHVDGSLGADSVVPITTKGLDDIYVTILANKIDELKETTGNRDISTGGTTSGVTAASAIAAMQEAGSKLSRDNSKASYRVFREICSIIVELIRQFYDLPRCFRILGENGTEQFVMYSNEGIVPQMQGLDFGMDMGVRVPQFDIEITAQKQSPYSKMSQNELALQFFSAGFFNPAIAEQALACLDMMDFDRKDFVMQKIQHNGMIYARYMAMVPQPQVGGSAEMPEGKNATSSNSEEESSVTKNARERVADSTSPR